MKFKYAKFTGKDVGTIYRPWIPITLKYKNINKPFNVLVDSGADFTLLPIEIAGLFNFELAGQPQIEIESASGDIFKIYKSPYKIEFILKSKGFRQIKWSSFAYFGESVPTILLGYKGCLERFEVRLNGKNKEVEILEQ